MPTLDTKIQLFIGVDPGASGGMAAVFASGDVHTATMPDDDQEVLNWFQQWQGVPRLAVLELVQGYIGGMEGGAEGEGPRGASMFKFGSNYGVLRMALTATRTNYQATAPITWMTGLNLFSRGSGKLKETKTQRKNRLKAVAQHQYPRLKVTKAIADALLLATYCKLKHEGKV